MSGFVIVRQSVTMDEQYLVAVPDGFDISADSEFGPLEYAQSHGAYIGAASEEFGAVQVSPIYNSHAEVIHAENMGTGLGPEQEQAQTGAAPLYLRQEQHAGLAKRIADYVFELTPGDVRSLITAEEALRASRDILQMILVELTSNQD